MSKGPYMSPSTGARKLGSSSTTRSPNVSNVFSRMTSKLNYSNNETQQHHRLKRYSSDDEWDDTKHVPREVSEHFKRYELMTEFINLRNSNHCPLGLYIMPSSENFNVWYGVLFVHKGYYSSGVFKFRVVISESYPEYPPSVTFMSDMFHPLIDVGGNLTICQQFLAWRPDESYIIHVLHYIKNIFKRAILDRLVDKICLNKDAYKLYRTDRKTFIKLARQCADLTITESYLFDHFPDDNLIKLSPMNDMKFANIRSQILPTLPSSKYLDESDVTSETALYEKLLEKAREMPIHEQENGNKEEETEMQVINKAESDENNEESLASEMIDKMVNGNTSDQILKEAKSDENNIIQQVNVELEEDIKTEGNTESDRMGDGNTIDSVPLEIEIKNKQAPVDNTQSETTWKDNIQDVIERDDDIEEDINQRGDPQSITIEDITVRESSVQENTEQKEARQNNDKQETIIQELAKQENNKQHHIQEEPIDKDDIEQVFIEQGDINQLEIRHDEIIQGDIHQENMKQAELEQGEVMKSNDKQEDNNNQAVEREKMIYDRIISEEVVILGEVIQQQETIENDLKQEPSQDNYRLPDAKYKEKIKQDEQDINEEKIMEEESRVEGSDYSNCRNDQVTKTDIDSEKVDRESEINIEVDIKRELEEKVEKNQTFDTISNEVANDTTGIQTYPADAIIVASQDMAINTEIESKDNKEEEIESPNEDPTFDSENSTPASPCDIIDSQSDNNIYVTDQNDIGQTESIADNAKHIHENDDMSLQQEADAVAIRQS